MRGFVTGLCALIALFAATDAQGFSLEEQLARTGFIVIDCDQENDAYTFTVNNNLALAISFRVDLRCKNNDARNSVQLATLAPFSSSPTPVTIKPAVGTVRNQECTLDLIGPDRYLQGGGDPEADYLYASRTRLCGRSLFDGAFDDDDDSCSYIECAGTRNWWHNGLVYYASLGVAILVGSIVVLVIAAVRNKEILDASRNWAIPGRDPNQLVSELRNNLSRVVEVDLKRERLKEQLLRESSGTPNSGTMLETGLRSMGAALFADEMDVVDLAAKHDVDEAYLRKAGTLFMDLIHSTNSVAAQGSNPRNARVYAGGEFSVINEHSEAIPLNDEAMSMRIESDGLKPFEYQPLHGGVEIVEEAAQLGAAATSSMAVVNDTRTGVTSSDAAVSEIGPLRRRTGQSEMREPRYTEGGGVV